MAVVGTQDGATELPERAVDVAAAHVPPMAAGLREELLRGLNGDLTAEYGAIIMYTTYAARVGGPFRPQLAELFRGEISDELGHARLLAEKIVDDGTPRRGAAHP